MSDDACDYLIVGGGASGCVMAARLSENTQIKVQLLEAGRVYAPEDEPAPIADIVARSFLQPAFTWPGMTTIPDPDPAHPQGGIHVPYMHGRVLGGGSAVNGMNAHRGLPEDYDEWAGYGVDGWGWRDVLPYFRKLEHDPDFTGELHGGEGPITISRWPRDRWSRFELAVDEDWASRQLPFVEDLNGPVANGRFPVSVAAGDGRRMSAARAYLTAAVRARRNLEIVGNVEVEQLVLENRRAVGVRIRRDGQSSVMRARHVILCAGGILTPTLLMRSGIGDPEALSQQGISPLLHRAGVGANFQNHHGLFLSAYLFKESRTTGRRPMTTSCVRYSSGVPGCGPTDMTHVALGLSPDGTARNALGRRTATLFTTVHKPYSRGSVMPTRQGLPHVLANMFSDERDLVRLVHGFRIIREQFEKLRAEGIVDQVFVPTSSGRTDDSILTTVLNSVAGVVLDSSSRVRDFIFGRTGILLDAIPKEGPELFAWARQYNVPGYHASGTCRMGRKDDPMAVVDSRCCMIGLAGVTVADTSIFPTLMRSGTYIPVVMVAEKVADMIKVDQRHLV